MLAIETILTEISPLKPVEKLKLIDEILHSLHETDPKIDELWAKEAEDRVEAYRTGTIASISIEKVFEKYSK